MLPFTNLSGDPGQAYFSDGVTEEVRDTLTGIQGLRVIGRVSASQVRDMSSRDIGAKLVVTAILTGSVRRSPTGIRVSVQLVDAARGDERWTEDYDRAPGDVLAIEAGIAKGVVSALEARLSVDEAFVGTSDPRALDLFLKASALEWGAGTPATHRQALELIATALAIDPRYVKDHAARADVLWDLAGAATHSGDKHRLMAQSEQSARQCLALPPRWSNSYALRAQVPMAHLDFRGALDLYLKAQTLDPDHIESLFPTMLAAIGRGENAVAAQAIVVSQDPLNPSTWGGQVMTAYLTRRCEQAVALTQQTLAWAPKMVWRRYWSENAHSVWVDRERRSTPPRCLGTTIGMEPASRP